MSVASILCTWYNVSFYVSRMLRRPLSIKKACWRPYRREDFDRAEILIGAEILMGAEIFRGAEILIGAEILMGAEILRGAEILMGAAILPAAETSALVLSYIV